MSTLNKILLGVVALLILVGVGLLIQKNVSGGSYYAVFMNGGEMYFGTLHRFPELALVNVYALQKNDGNTKTPFSLAKFGDAFWGPKDVMRLNRNNVLWMSELKDDSAVVKFIESKNAGK